MGRIRDSHVKAHTQLCVLNGDSSTHSPGHGDAHDTLRHCLATDTEEGAKRRKPYTAKSTRSSEHVSGERAGITNYHPWPLREGPVVGELPTWLSTTRFCHHSQSHGQEWVGDCSGAPQLTLWGSLGHPCSDGPGGMLGGRGAWVREKSCLA